MFKVIFIITIVILSLYAFFKLLKVILVCAAPTTNKNNRDTLAKKKRELEEIVEDNDYIMETQFEYWEEETKKYHNRYGGKIYKRKGTDKFWI